MGVPPMSSTAILAMRPTGVSPVVVFAAHGTGKMPVPLTGKMPVRLTGRMPVLREAPPA